MRPARFVLELKRESSAVQLRDKCRFNIFIHTVCHNVFLTAVLYVWHFHFLSSEFPRKDPQRPDAREENEIYMVKVICDVNNDT